MAVVTPTGRPKSVRNRCIIEIFGVVFVLSLCFLEFSVGESIFVIELSQMFSPTVLVYRMDHLLITDRLPN